MYISKTHAYQNIQDLLDPHSEASWQKTWLSRIDVSKLGETLQYFVVSFWNVSPIIEKEYFTKWRVDFWHVIITYSLIGYFSIVTSRSWLCPSQKGGKHQTQNPLNSWPLLLHDDTCCVLSAVQVMKKHGETLKWALGSYFIFVPLLLHRCTFNLSHLFKGVKKDEKSSLEHICI